MIYDILEDKIEALGFARGDQLFRNTFPADVPIGVMVRMPLDGVQIDPEIPDWYRAEFQVIVRHTDPVEGNLMALRIQRALDLPGVEHYPASAERGSARIDVFRPKTLPIQFPSLEGGGFEFSQRFNAIFQFEMPELD